MCELENVQQTFARFRVVIRHKIDKIFFLIYQHKIVKTGHGTDLQAIKEAFSQI